MILLPFGCYCSPLKVHPKNWQTSSAPIKKDWYIFYRFYDPVFKDSPKLKKGKLVIIKGVNHFKTRKERQTEIQLLLDQEVLKLKEAAYNPITGKSMHIQESFEIEPFTPFIEALTKAEQRVQVAPSTKRDLRSMMRYVTNAAIHLRYDELPIKVISRKHLKQVLSHIDIYYGENAYRYNKIRSYLMILYKELIELETVEVNPLRDIAKKKRVQKLRKLPSMEDRRIIDEYLKEHQYRLWLFMHIFFHSGARLTEMMNVKKEDVNLSKQTFVITIKKGSYYKEVEKPIKNIALPYWFEAMSAAENEDFIFSKGLEPGKVPIQSFQITKRWNLHVKKKLGIKEDFYSLKHLNLDETAAILSISDAAAMASHTSTTITLKYYAINETQRQNERLKLIENKFS